MMDANSYSVYNKPFTFSFKYPLKPNQPSNYHSNYLLSLIFLLITLY